MSADMPAEAQPEMPFDVTSPRLTYRPLREADWPFYLAVSQDRSVMKYISDPRSAEEIRTRSFDVRLPAWYRGCTHWLCLVIEEKSTGLPAGFCGFIDRGDGIAESGFMLAADAQGKGYGSESLRAIIAFCFAQQAYRKMTATVTAGNEASRRTLLAAGFVQEGTLRENYFLDGQWQDDWVFGLLKQDYRPAR
ncbi:GNAT family protein [Pantoea sp. GD03673]|uniref:GNAT family N-acetyltransferase n=1 Tax=Pantoea sp. GD03673 TaxID=2975364 RepID=UPI00244BCC5F|nr:GNAT family protein [Pantoea sp. GD03673]MDH2069286.1 GNAT family N-acetyltransferase [Pantoea sp. GD03673]